MDEYTILRKKKPKNGFATTAILGIIAVILLGIVLFLFLLGRSNKNKNSNVNNIVAKGSETSEKTTNQEKSDIYSNGNCLVGSTEFIFNNNLRTIKEAAVSYFTIERLPSKIGETKTLTLKEMQNKKLVLNVIDSNGNYCDGKSSRVEVTKEKTEYVMKIYLSCSDMEDYIVIHLGCYDYCKGNVCEKQIEDEPEFEYEYKKTTSCTMGDWSNWGEWKTKREKTSNTKKEDTKVVTSKKTITDTKNPIVGATTYNCDKYGKDYELDGKYCVKTTSRKEIVDAKPSNYSYVCDNGYELNGTKCEKEVTTTDTKDATANPPVYYCENGYSLNSNNKCTKVVTVTEEKSLNITCPNGYTLSGTTCTKNYSEKETIKATVNYTCASGYTKDGTNCYRMVDKTDKKNANITCPSGYTLSGTTCTKKYNDKETKGAYEIWTTQTVKEPYSCNKQVCTTKTVLNSKGQLVPQTSCETQKRTCYKEVPYSVFGGYYCASGYTLSGSSCTRTVEKTDKKNATITCASGYSLSGTTCTKNYSEKEIVKATVSYTCASGYTKDGTNCYRIINKTDKQNATITCDSGFTKKDNKCVRSYNETLTDNAKVKPTTYSCPTGYKINSNNKCTKTTVKTEVVNAKKVIGGYVCDTGYKLNGTKCEKTIVNTDTKSATSVIGKTTCPTGYNLKNNKCTKTITEEIKTTYYRYATRSCTGGSVDTKWSIKDDKDLLNDGYKLTGNKRTVTVTEK